MRPAHRAGYVMPGQRKPHRKMAADGARAEDANAHGGGSGLKGLRRKTSLHKVAQQRNRSYGHHLRSRAVSRTVTTSPVFLPRTSRVSALTGSLCTPPPMAMNALLKGCPSIVPRTLTRPRVSKNAADSGQMT